MTSCRDAADKRERLGKRGIPLKDELKSFLGRGQDSEGGELLILAHCNAVFNFDFAKVQKAVGSTLEIERLGSEEAEALGFGYGLVNPFLSEDELKRLNLLHIFDQRLISRHGLPGSMMTNLGDRNWGVEFFCDELIIALPPEHVIRADIIENVRETELASPSPVGIITGNSPESGMVLWRYLNKAVRDLLGDQFLGDISFPRVAIQSLPAMGLSMELETRANQVWPHIERAIYCFENEGIKAFALACHTTQYFREDIERVIQPTGMTFVDAPSTLRDYCQTQGVRDFGFIGGRQAASFGTWSAFRHLDDDFEIRKMSDVGLRYVHDLAYEVKRTGPSSTAMQKLNHVLKREFGSGTVVIGLTELSTLLEWEGKLRSREINAVDLLDLLAQRMAKMSLD